ncbi:MAG: hypothetical protein A3J74_01975 [Elusimicrobia bacterium RIFCSPHIGHO2_02_FULL_57_9]|nr:MAG: hypothetical protein A3J74_01975 [Elusimicrobia bacterium RIFCSPHIGHO2_02_FULL_57_9]
MRGAPDTIILLRPRSTRQALEVFAQNPHAVPLAGGTDFMVSWNMGLHNGKTVLDISALRSWRKISAAKTGVRIGALATHADLQRHPALRREFSLLTEACSEIGAAAIQNRGTLGGNIANASPAGDSFPPQAVYEAKVHAVSAQARRLIPFNEIFVGVKKTVLRPGELIESVEIPFLKPRPSRQYFRKVGTRAAQALSKTVAAGLLWLSRDGRVSEMRFALGSMATMVRRLKSAEHFVQGKKLTSEVIDHACELLAKDVSPIDDVRSTAQYRLKVSRNLLREFLSGR